MEELLRRLKQVSNEPELFEELLKAVLEGDARMTAIASKIQAARDIRFDLEKVMKEHDYLRRSSEKNVSEAAEAQVHA